MDDDRKLTLIREENEDVLKALEEKYYGRPEKEPVPSGGNSAKPGKKKKAVIASAACLILAGIIVLTAVLFGKNAEPDLTGQTDAPVATGTDGYYKTRAVKTCAVRLDDIAESAFENGYSDLSENLFNSAYGDTLMDCLHTGASMCNKITYAFRVDGPVRIYQGNHTEFTLEYIPFLADPDTAFDYRDVDAIETLPKESAVCRGSFYYRKEDGTTNGYYSGTVVYRGMDGDGITGTGSAESGFYVSKAELIECPEGAMLSSVTLKHYASDTTYVYRFYYDAGTMNMAKVTVDKGEPVNGKGLVTTGTVCEFSENRLSYFYSQKQAVSYKYESGKVSCRYIREGSEETDEKDILFDKNSNITGYAEYDNDELIRDCRIDPDSLPLHEYRYFSCLKGDGIDDIYMQEYGVIPDFDFDKIRIRERFVYNGNTGEGVFSVFDARGDTVATGPASYDGGEWRELTEAESSIPLFSTGTVFRRIVTNVSAIRYKRQYYGKAHNVSWLPQMTVIDKEKGTFELYAIEKLPIPTPLYYSNTVLASVQVKYTGTLTETDGAVNLHSLRSEYVGLWDDTYESLIVHYGGDLGKYASQEYALISRSADEGNFEQALDDYFKGILDNDDVAGTNRLELTLNVNDSVCAMIANAETD